MFDEPALAASVETAPYIGRLVRTHDPATEGLQIYGHIKLAACNGGRLRPVFFHCLGSMRDDSFQLLAARRLKIRIVHL